MENKSVFFNMTSSSYRAGDSLIKSPVFPTSNEPGNSLWHLKIKIQKIGSGCVPVLSIALTYCGSDQNIKAKYSICVIDDGKNRQFIWDSITYHNFKNCEEFKLRELKVGELYKERDKYLPDDTLTISLELTELIVRSNTSQPITQLRLKESKQIVDDLPAFFHSKKGSDAFLIVGDKKIPVHKNLLMNQSNVFREMLTCHQTNNRNNEVNITDMDPDILEKLLEFIYTDNVTNLDEVDGRLYEVADKYQLPALKEFCEESFCKNVNVENAIKCLVLLDLHNADQQFLNYLVDFIAINSKIITETEEYKKLLNTNLELLLTVTTKICNLRKNRKINILENQYCDIKWMIELLLFISKIFDAMEDIKIIKTQSTIEERKIIYEWKINQFLSITSSPMNCATPDSIIESPVFSTTNIPGDSSWRLKISYGSSSYGPYLSIALKYCGGVEKIKAKYSICIIDDEKNRQFIRGEQAYQTFKDSRDCTAHCINANELNKEKDQYVPNDTLTVSLELTELMVRSYTSIPITKLQLEESKQIVDDLKDLFHSKEGSDVVLIVGDKKIPAHKTLLMNQSNVFREMLTCHQKNNKNNEVNIPDMNYDICKKLLEFIYTGNVTNFDEVAVRLFEAADKYQIPALKKLCEKSFCKNVNGENAVQYLVLLDRHNADQEFLNYIADFIANNSKIFTVSEYIALLNTNPALLLILTTKINNPTKNRMHEGYNIRPPGRVTDLFKQRSKLIPNNSFTVLLELTEFFVRSYTRRPITTFRLKRSKQVVDDFPALFHSKDYSDIILLAGDKKIPAHRALLMHRNIVFRAILTCHKKNEVNIISMDPDILEKLLEFIYTDNVTNLDEVAERLFGAADNYQIPALKNLCEESLCKNKKRLKFFLFVFKLFDAMGDLQFHSRAEGRKIMYEWKIEQFFSKIQISRFYNTDYGEIQSRVLSSNNGPGSTSWYLKIDLNNKQTSFESLSITLVYRGGGHQKIRAIFSMCIIDNEKNQQFQQKGTKILKNCGTISIPMFVHIDDLLNDRNKLVPNDTLTVSFKIIEFIVPSNTRQLITQLRLKESKQIVGDSAAFFHSKEGSDVILVVGDKRIPAHKALLMNRNTVFRAMLTHHTRNTRNNEVNIPDMDPDVLEKLLEFIYTDNVTNLDEVAGRLLEAADKYQIPALKKLCEESLCTNITVGNAVQYLVLLDRHNANEKFLNYVVDFIGINSKIITETEEYKALLNTNPALLLTVLKKICSSN
ncbi:uncharacterized protein LOC130663218 [Microplitis mediator]|uniref:uncharacterized protein LOC130663218 n=1 Tax=Microplitis mediator TaxID=375433 RepID=UPI002556F1B3|nr:uncharacterized protein LOC130663218 [Microplitis mediator]